MAGGEALAVVTGVGIEVGEAACLAGTAPAAVRGLVALTDGQGSRRTVPGKPPVSGSGSGKRSSAE